MVMLKISARLNSRCKNMRDGFFAVTIKEGYGTSEGKPSSYLQRRGPQYMYLTKDLHLPANRYMGFFISGGAAGLAAREPVAALCLSTFVLSSE